MRHLTLVCAAAALVSSAGCKPPPKDQAIDMFQSDVRRYFNELNREAMDRKERLRGDLARAKVNPYFDTATGTVYNTFSFDPAGFVVENYKCQACGTSLALAAAEAEVLCKSCGHSPYRSHVEYPDLSKVPSPCPKC